MAMSKTGIVLSVALAGGISFCLCGCRYRGGDFPGSAETGDSSDSGQVTVAKMGGEIDVKSAPHGANLSTMGGDIHLGDVASSAKVKTMGGVITIDHATGSVDASTMGGPITIGHVEGALKASTMGGEITARMAGTSSSERDVELTSHGGTITLTVPKDFPMDVRIQLAYTKNAPRTYEIIDHIGLEKRETSDWDNSFGSPRKYIRARGRVGNGLNHVVIETINGDVILKQE